MLLSLAHFFFSHLNRSCSDIFLQLGVSHIDASLLKTDVSDHFVVDFSYLLQVALSLRLKEANVSKLGLCLFHMALPFFVTGLI